MKTKALYLKVIIGLAFVAMVNSVAISQENKTGDDLKPANNSNSEQAVWDDDQLDIQDWMLDDLAFIYRSENPQIQEWMVKLVDNMESWNFDEYSDANMMMEYNYGSNMDLSDRLNEDKPYTDSAFPESFYSADMMEWMFDEEFSSNQYIEEEPVEIQKWMLSDDISSNCDNDIVLQNWMLDQKCWR